jgi:hypothetical protein
VLRFIVEDIAELSDQPSGSTQDEVGGAGSNWLVAGSDSHFLISVVDMSASVSLFLLLFVYFICFSLS